MSNLSRDGVAGCLFPLKGKGDAEIRYTLKEFLLSKGCSEDECITILGDLASYPEYQPKQGD